MISRREILLTLITSALAAPLIVEAQPTAKVRRIGFLSIYSALFHRTRFSAFKQGLADLGYVEGKNIAIEARWADDKRERLAGLAAELTRLPLDVLVAHGSSGGEHAKQATGSIPIVFVAHPDPVGMGIVSNLRRPGGNVTGLSDLHADLAAKRLELLKDTLPSASRIAVLLEPGNRGHEMQLKEIQAAATNLRVTVIPIPILRSAENMERVFTAIKAEGIAALSVLGGAVGGHRKKIAVFALQNRVPTISTTDEAAEEGMLMSYGASHADLYRRAATYVDKILKGAKPGDLPIEQPTTFELVVNMNTARALGIRIPDTVMARADRVIQ